MSPKWEPGDQEEIEDDEPLSAEDRARMDAQRIRGQSALISRAASRGMTPMEFFASGQVTAQAPDDALAFDKSRQLPAPEERPAISEEESSGFGPETWSREILFTSTPIMRNGHFKDDCQLCGGPCRQTELWELASKKLGEGMERLLESYKMAVDPAKDPEDTVVIVMRETNSPTIYPGRQERPQTPLQKRMDEWLAKDGGRSFMEGFASYGDVGFGNIPDAAEALKRRTYCEPHGNMEPCAVCAAGSVLYVNTPRAGEGEAVPPTSDDEVAEGEIVGDPVEMLRGKVLRPEVFYDQPAGDEDIVDAEVVEDE